MSSCGAATRAKVVSPTNWCEVTVEQQLELNPYRGKRLFLLLSIFIVVFSGLLGMSFCMTIDYLTGLLQGSVPGPHQLRLSLFQQLWTFHVLGGMVRYVFPDVATYSLG